MSPDNDFLPSPRVTYYNASLSEAGLAKMTDSMRAAVLSGEYDDGSTSQGGRLVRPDAYHPYNLISSLCQDGFHRPALDCDWADFDTAEEVASVIACNDFWRDNGMRIVVVASTTNWHVYLPDVAYPHDEYMELIDALEPLDVLERAYVDASIMRGQTLLRPPHVTKAKP